jgi:alkylation response protein AidB-like acyl-CoA dehydrogenase
MVEKIKRDVRITTIYEGTSEIMEITIARGRWQEHLKSGGDYYHARARELEALHAEHPTVGADIAALAHHALAELLEQCRVERLTRHQHILMRLGALIAQGEGAAALARRAQRAADKQLNPKGSRRLRAGALAAASRVYARGAALVIATEAVRCVAGADGKLSEFEQRLDLASIHRAQGGLMADLEAVREAVYGRMRP